MLQNTHLGDFRQGGHVRPLHAIRDGRYTIAHFSGNLFLDVRDENTPFARTAQFKDDLFVPLGLMEAPEF